MERRRHVGVAIASVLILAAAGCDSPASPGSDGEIRFQVQQTDGIAFMTQNVVPAETMDALYEGPLTVETGGCIRIPGPDNHTVVWPHGYSMQVQFDGITIFDENDEAVGVIGDDTFSLPGGEVPTLLESMGFTEEDRELAEEHCPGRYWIVG